MKSGSLLLLSLASDASMVRERCWVLEGKATPQIEQETEDRSDSCILAIIMHSPNTPL